MIEEHLMPTSRRKYRCLCGFQAEVIEKTTFTTDDNLFRTETTIEFNHGNGPILLVCSWLMIRYREEQKAILRGRMDLALHNLR